MKINDILNEDLGTLAQLGVGPLINVLKQPAYGRSYDGKIGQIGPRFHGSLQIGSTSEIKEFGPIKNLLKSLRKLFRDHDDARAFAVYIGGHPVMFGVTTGYELAGSSRENKIAYDLTKYADVIDKPPAELTTVVKKEPGYFDRDKTPKPHAGKIFSTGQLSTILDLIDNIAYKIKEPITIKLVMADVVAQAKRQQRSFTKQEIIKGAVDLRTRLAIYKNQKHPTVKTIDEFIAMSLKNPGKIVQFAGYTYKLIKQTYDKISPIDLLAGVAFNIQYKAIDPGLYESLTVTYRYEQETNQLIPIKAEWYDKSSGEHMYDRRQVAILDAPGYLKSELKVKKIEKNTVLRYLISEMENERYRRVLQLVDALKTAGYDWPELDILENNSKKLLGQ